MLISTVVHSYVNFPTAPHIIPFLYPNIFLHVLLSTSYIHPNTNNDILKLLAKYLGPWVVERFQ